VDAAAADFKIDVLDGDEAFEFFCEIPGFKYVVTLHELPPVARSSRARLTSEPCYRFFTYISTAYYRVTGSFIGNYNLARVYDGFIVFDEICCASEMFEI
jgi:hypothetical protein